MQYSFIAVVVKPLGRTKRLRRRPALCNRTQRIHYVLQTNKYHSIVVIDHNPGVGVVFGIYAHCRMKSTNHNRCS